MVAVARVASPRPVSRPAPRPAPQLLVPADLLPFPAQQALAALLARRVAILHKYAVIPFTRYGVDSAPLAPERAAIVFARSNLRRLCLALLRDLLGMELERVQALLLEAWDAPPQPAAEEPPPWHAALMGALRRVGQIFQEMQRRRSADAALAVLRETINALPF